MKREGGKMLRLAFLNGHVIEAKVMKKSKSKKK